MGNICHQKKAPCQRGVPLLLALLASPISRRTFPCMEGSILNAEPPTLPDLTVNEHPLIQGLPQ